MSEVGKHDRPYSILTISIIPGAFTTRVCRSGAEVAGWTLDRTIRFDSRLTLTVCGPSDGKEVKDVFWRPGARVGVGSAH